MNRIVCSKDCRRFDQQLDAMPRLKRAEKTEDTAFTETEPGADIFSRRLGTGSRDGAICYDHQLFRGHALG